MTRLHNRLMNVGWYASWQNNPLHTFSHWAAFLLVVFIAGTGLTHQIDTAYGLANVLSSQDQSALSKPAYMPNELLIKVTKTAQGKVHDGGAKESGIRALQVLDQKNHIKSFKAVARRGAKSDTSAAVFRWYKVTFSNPLDTLPPGLAKNSDKHGLPDHFQEIVDQIMNDPSVADVQPNYIVTVQTVPNDSYYGATGTWGQSYPDMYGLQKMGMAGAWDQQKDSSSIVVADIDTGADYTHPDLAPNIWTNPGEIPNNGIDDDHNGFIDDVHGWDFLNNDNDPMDDQGHGSHTAGTIDAVGNNGAGVVGVNWNAKLMPLKFLGNNGGSDADAISALVYAADNGARVSSNSWAGTGANRATDDAVKYEHDKGMVVVVAAGNSNVDALEFNPADADNAITVAASDWDDSKAWFSDWGEKIDVAAPGVNILSLKASQGNMCGSGITIGGAYCYVSGTSMATPHVSGLAALLLAKNPKLTPEEVRQIIRMSADDTGLPGPDSYFGYGRVNASTTLANAFAHPLTPYISSPRSHDVVGGPSLAITGSVQGVNFASYVVETASGRAPPWTTIKTSTVQPVTDSTLVTLDTTTIPDGTYMIRVTGIDKSGKKYFFQVHEITVHNFDVSISGPTQFASRGQVSVTGKAATLSGTPFGNYKLEAINDSTGISTLIKTSSSPIANGTLGVWDTSAYTDGTVVRLRLTVTAANGTASVAESKLLVDNTVAAGWPKTFLNSSGLYLNDGPYIVDLDNDGKKEMVMSIDDESGSVPHPRIVAYKSDGSVQSGFPIEISGGSAGALASISDIRDLDGDGKPELVLRTGYIPDTVIVQTYRSNGTKYGPDIKTPEGVFTDDFVRDMNGDGKLDIATFWAYDATSYDASGNVVPVIKIQRLYVYNPATGAVFSGYPKDVTSQELGGAQASFMEDMNGDGHQEIGFVIGSAAGAKVFLLNDQLQPLPGFPYSIPQNVDPGDLRGLGINFVISRADTDGDGRKEMYIESDLDCPSQTLCFYGRHPEVVGIRIDGTSVSGYPKLGDSEGWGMGIADHPSVSHADIDGDGLDDVVLPSTPLAIYTKSGLTKLSGTPSIGTSIGIADVNGDGKLDYTATDGYSGSNVYVFGSNGPTLWQRPLSWVYTAPLLADLDGDGQLEIITTSYTRLNNDQQNYPNGRQITVWHLNTGNYKYEWPMTNQNFLRNNNLKGSGVLGSTTPPVEPPPPVPAVAHIIVSPTALTFSAGTNSAPSPQVISISNSGSTTLNWSATTNQTWCHVSQGNGIAVLDVVNVDDITTESAANISVSVDASATAGTKNCMMTISDPNADNSPQIVAVTYIITPVVAPDTSVPTVGITSPTNNAQVKKNANVTIKANASDNVGVAKVEFYIDGALKCSDIISPYTCSWKVPNVTGKSYLLQAKAYDAAGNAGSSATVTVKVK